MANDFGYRNTYQRARADLSERCLHWLGAVLKYKVPPGRVLELGSAHGGFVSILRWAGFDATGPELRPSVVSIARELFDVPMLQGRVEDQNLDGLFDVIVLLDILEHLPDPDTHVSRRQTISGPDSRRSPFCRTAQGRRAPFQPEINRSTLH